MNHHSPYGRLDLLNASTAVTGGGVVSVTYTGSLFGGTSIFLGETSQLRVDGGAVILGPGSVSDVGFLHVGGTSSSEYGSATLSNGGQLTASVNLNSSGLLAIGAMPGDTAASPGIFGGRSIQGTLPTGSVLPPVLVLNHTSDDYWLTSTGTADGDLIALGGTGLRLFHVAGTTHFNTVVGTYIDSLDGLEKRLWGDAGSISVRGGKAVFAAGTDIGMGIDGGSLLIGATLASFPLATPPAGEVVVESGGMLALRTISVGAGVNADSSLSIEGSLHAFQSMTVGGTGGRATISVAGTGNLTVEGLLNINTGSAGQSSVLRVGENGALHAGEVRLAYTTSLSTSTSGKLAISESGLLDIGDGNGTLSVGVRPDASTQTVSGEVAIGSLSGETPAPPGILNAGEIAGGSGTATLTFNHSSGGYYFTKTGSSGGEAIVRTGNLSIVHESGVTHLVGAGANSGPVALHGGTLVISDVGADSVLGTGTVWVGENATLQGNGRIGGDAEVEGTLSPGNSAGFLTFGGSLTLESTATITMELGGTSPTLHDRILVDDTLGYGGTLQISFIGGFMPQVGDWFGLFTAAHTTPSTSFTSIQFLTPGYEGFFDYDIGTLTITAVPESSAFMLLGLAVFAFAVLRRHRRSSAIRDSRVP